MKTIRFIIAAIIVSAFTVNASAQVHDHAKTNADQVTSKNENFKVWGKCDMCKARIEKTVTAEGATSASWDSKTQLLTVAYDTLKTSKEALSKKLAAAGHDTEKFKATDEAYNKLPECCHYERQK
jgi:mercuric ion binding protein